MTGHRKLLLGVVVVTAVLAVGTGSYTAVSADRGLNLGIAGEGDGLLAVAGNDVEISHRQPQTVTIATVGNQFGSEMTVTDVEVSGDGPSPPVFQRYHVDGGPTVVPGGEADVKARINCGANQPAETWTVTVTATSGGATVTTDVDVTVECTFQTPSPNGGNASQGQGPAGGSSLGSPSG